MPLFLYLFIAFDKTRLILCPRFDIMSVGGGILCKRKKLKKQLTILKARIFRI